MMVLGWLGRLLGGKRRNTRGQGRRRMAAEGTVSFSSTVEAQKNISAELTVEEPAITEEELTGLDQHDREMLRSIISLDDTTAREVMVPRLDMVALEAGSPLDMVVKTMVERGHSRLPVYEGNIDRILGIVYARDLMAALASPEQERDLRSLTRPAFIVPETKRVDELLDEFRQRRTQIAIVVDEYGGTEGLVTMEDVLEEIVGEIEDEFSRARDAEVIRQADGAAHVSAGLSTEDVEGLFGVDIESDDFDTVGGFVYHSLGRIPHVGDVVENGKLRVEVLSMAGRRLRTLKITNANGGSTGTSG